MRFTSSRLVKNIVSILAIVNIILMMVFQYGLPSPAMVTGKNSAGQESEGDANVGTIEAVEKEAAQKEEAAAETALARYEKEEVNETDEEERDPDAPVLELTDDHIYLHVGDRFNYMSYIKTMEDVDGSDLSHYIYLDRDVNTYEPGEIELTYRITSTITGKSTSKVLLITILE